MVPLHSYLILSAIMFIVGALGVVTRRNAIIVFLSLELMLNSVNLTLVAFSAFFGDATGQALVFFVMTVAPLKQQSVLLLSSLSLDANRL